MNRIVTLCCSFVFFGSASGQSIFDKHGALVRSDTTEKIIYLCFTGHDFDEGFDHVLSVLKQNKIKASFFLTGDFVRNHTGMVKSMADEGHFVGAHSDKHLLYCDWSKRDRLLHSTATIKQDIMDNLVALSGIGIHPIYFMPPYEWYNNKVVDIASELNQTTVNFTSGTNSNADYTTPDMHNYKPSKEIIENIYHYEKSRNMNGFHLLIHPGVSPSRLDKLYLHLDTLITYFRSRGYGFAKFNAK